MKAEAVFETMAALPDLPGPKLYPLCYEGQTLEIDFIEHIAVGADATIWKVSIEKNTYALKIFGFGNGVIKRVPRVIEGKVTGEELRLYEDPFNAECRAYGRLKETGHEHLSIKCYGYIILTSSHEQKLVDNGGMVEAIERTLDEFKDLPLRAIVKEFVSNGRRLYPYLDPKKVPRMIRDLNSLHRVGIFVDDIRDDNYLRDVNIDFSRSKTVPHPMYNKEYIKYVDKHPHGKNYTAWVDDTAFDRMIDWYNQGIEEGRHQNPYIWSRMHGRTTTGHPRYDFRHEKKGNPFPRVRPELFNWEGVGEGTQPLAEELEPNCGSIDKKAKKKKNNYKKKGGKGKRKN